MEGKVTVSPVCLEPCCSFPGDVGLVLAAVPVQHSGSTWLSPAPVNVPINHGSPGCWRGPVTGNGRSHTVNVMFPISEVLLLLRCRSHPD